MGGSRWHHRFSPLSDRPIPSVHGRTKKPNENAYLHCPILSPGQGKEWLGRLARSRSGSPLSARPHLLFDQVNTHTPRNIYARQFCIPQLLSHSPLLCLSPSTFRKSNYRPDGQTFLPPLPHIENGNRRVTWECHDMGFATYSIYCTSTSATFGLFSSKKNTVDLAFSFCEIFSFRKQIFTLSQKVNQAEVFTGEVT
jgi:hypothetical protein